MDLLVQILKALWALRPQRFWLIWVPITTASLIYVISMVGSVPIPMRQETSRTPWKVILTREQIWNPRAVIALTLLATFLVSYIATILIWEDFAYYDNDQLTLYSVKGRSFPLPIWRDNGRFFPFGLQEFNLIGHFTRTPIGYHVFPIIQLLVLFWILLIFDAELSITASAGLAALALLTPSIFVSFSGLIFPERNVLFLLACFMLSVRQFERTKTVAWAVAAVVSAQIMLYFKEMAFLLLFGFAAGRLILRCRNGLSAQSNYERLWNQENRLDLCLASLAVLFVFAYFAVMGIHGSMDYITMAREPTAEVALDYLKLDFLVWSFIAVVLYRIYLIWRRRKAPCLFWDGLGFGGVACFLGFLNLGRSTAYFLAPVDLIALLYVGRLALLSWKTMQSWGKVAILTLAFAIVLQNLSISTFAALERKNVIHARVELASVIVARYRHDIVPNLFFPFACSYSIMEFIVYLNYRGVPVKGAWTNRAIAKEQYCMKYRKIMYHPANSPTPGDLVIVLPDDEASTADALAYRRQGELLFYYEPRFFPIPHLLYPLVGSYPLKLDENNNAFPDRWMDASVSVW